MVNIIHQKSENTSNVNCRIYNYIGKAERRNSGGCDMKKTTGRRHLFPPFDRFFLLLTLLLSAAAIAFSAGALPPEQSAAIPSSCENLQLGIPGEADRILDREGFALGYLNRHGQAAWVIYRLTRARLTARPVERCGSFRRDPALPAESVTPATIQIAPGAVTRNRSETGPAFFSGKLEA